MAPPVLTGAHRISQPSAARLTGRWSCYPTTLTAACRCVI